MPTNPLLQQMRQQGWTVRVAPCLGHTNGTATRAGQIHVVRLPGAGSDTESRVVDELARVIGISQKA